MSDKFRQFWLFGVCILLLAAGCQTDESDLPPGQAVWVDPKDSRLILNMPELARAQLRIRRYREKTGRLVEEVAEWYGLEGRNIIAGLVLSESNEGPPLTDPQDPNEVAASWAAFQKQKPAYGGLEQSANILGPVLWRRASIGTRAC
ncbi:MAG TPA: hypothetical protein DCS82_12465, partial [Rhodospirillaceae bacterium]|nr:hypothetical protein [Rhodospirillaceae bacterium]